MCLFYLPKNVFGYNVPFCFANQNFIQVSDIFYLTVGLKLINFNCQISLFVPEMSTSFTSYID